MLALAIAFPYSFPITETFGESVVEPATSELASTIQHDPSMQLADLPPDQKARMELPRRLTDYTIDSDTAIEMSNIQADEKQA